MKSVKNRGPILHDCAVRMTAEELVKNHKDSATIMGNKKMLITHVAAIGEGKEQSLGFCGTDGDGAKKLIELSACSVLIIDKKLEGLDRLPKGRPTYVRRTRNFILFIVYIY